MRPLLVLSQGLLCFVALGPVKESEVASLIETLKGGDEEARFFAACDLQKFGSQAEAAIPSLVEAMTKGDSSLDSSLRLAAREALIQIGPTAAPPLVQVLNDHHLDMEVRCKAASALGFIGGPTASAALIETLKDKDARIRAFAAMGLGNAGGKGAVRALLSATKDSDPQVRGYAAQALAELGSEPEAVVPALMRLLRDPDMWVRWMAADALAAFGPKAKSALPALVQVVTDEFWFARNSATWALGEIGPDAAPAVPALVQALNDQRWEVRETAARALGQIGPEAKAGVPALIRLLNGSERSEWIGCTAIEAIGRIGTDAPGVVPALLKASQDNAESVRQLAREWLARIRTDQGCLLLRRHGLRHPRAAGRPPSRRCRHGVTPHHVRLRCRCTD